MKVKRILGKVCSLVQIATATIETSVDFGSQGPALLQGSLRSSVVRLID